jgi:hypothetical protein
MPDDDTPDYKVGYKKPPLHTRFRKGQSGNPRGRQRAEELRHGQAAGPAVRLRAPAGVGAVQLLSGIHRNVLADGTIEMTETDAAPLLRAGWARVDPGDLSQSGGRLD